MPYYNDNDLDLMADTIYDRVQQRLASDTTYALERERGRVGKLRRWLRTVVVDVATFLFGKVVGTVVDIVLAWILD
jgi:hypothetical protein